MRWVGIDEAGYGPNLGPLVMTAVMAESSVEKSRDGRQPQPSTSGTTCVRQSIARGATRSGSGSTTRRRSFAAARDVSGSRPRLWQQFMPRLRACPRSLRALLEIVGAGTFDDVELSGWLESTRDRRSRSANRWRAGAGGHARARPAGALGRTVADHGCAQRGGGPARFNRGLEDHGLKSAVHYGAFEQLLAWVWGRTPDDVRTEVVGDKHGGRHYYYASTHTFVSRKLDRPRLRGAGG